MDLDRRALDRWITRGPDDYDEDDRLPCASCGADLPAEPETVTPWEDTASCDGTVRLIPQHYDDHLIAILGDEYRDKTYDVAFSDCGPDMGEHEPHVEVLWAGDDETRTCPACGVANVRRLG